MEPLYRFRIIFTVLLKGCAWELIRCGETLGLCPNIYVERKTNQILLKGVNFSSLICSFSESFNLWHAITSSAQADGGNHDRRELWQTESFFYLVHIVIVIINILKWLQINYTFSHHDHRRCRTIATPCFLYWWIWWE